MNEVLQIKVIRSSTNVTGTIIHMTVVSKYGNPFHKDAVPTYGFVNCRM